MHTGRTRHKLKQDDILTTYMTKSPSHGSDEELAQTAQRRSAICSLGDFRNLMRPWATWPIFAVDCPLNRGWTMQYPEVLSHLKCSDPAILYESRIGVLMCKERCSSIRVSRAITERLHQQQPSQSPIWKTYLKTMKKADSQTNGTRSGIQGLVQ